MTIEYYMYEKERQKQYPHDLTYDMSQVVGTDTEVCSSQSLIVESIWLFLYLLDDCIFYFSICFGKKIEHIFFIHK
jgi:hypothetical protein